MIQAKKATFLLLGLFWLWAQEAGASGYVVQFQTLGSSFSPAAYCSTTPRTFLWNWSDGTTSTDNPVGSIDFGFSGDRTQYLTIDPPGAVTNINIGYDASDWGDSNNIILRPAQNVGAVYFLQPLTNLQFWGSSYSPITNTLDFSGFTALQDIECWHCGPLQHVVVANLPSLRRVCFEACDLQELDVTGDPNLEEIRAALNSFDEVRIGGGTGPKVWHFCVRENLMIKQDFQEIMTNFYSLREPWYWDTGQSGALKFVSTNLTDVEVFDNRYEVADFSGQSNMTICLVYNNNLTNLIIDGCTALQDFEAENNNLPGEVLDSILAALDTSCPAISFVDLSQNPGIPSAAGYIHYVNLTNRGVTVNADWPAYTGPVLGMVGASLLAESCVPPNNAVDPGETVSMSFTIGNTGQGDAANLLVSLIETNGVVAPSGPQNFGFISAGSGTSSGIFTFTAAGQCGGTITATFQLRDGSLNLGFISVPIALGQLVAVSTQNFDSVSAPALPPGWTTTANGGQSPWVTTTSSFDTSSNSAFSPDAPSIGENALVSPPISLAPGLYQLVFANSYDLEENNSIEGFDGGVLEIKIGTGPFMDILQAGGTFITNGYNRVISSDFGNPLAGRRAWSGNSGGFLTTAINLPSSAVGQPVQFRWRCGTDSTTGSTGWSIDSISINGRACCGKAAPVIEWIGIANGQATLRWSSVAGMNYRVQYTSDLKTNNWNNVTPDVSAVGPSSSVTNAVGNDSRRFYRVILLP
jgi:hypothetical protein